MFPSGQIKYRPQLGFQGCPWMCCELPLSRVFPSAFWGPRASVEMTRTVVGLEVAELHVCVNVTKGHWWHRRSSKRYIGLLAPEVAGAWSVGHSNLHSTLPWGDLSHMPRKYITHRALGKVTGMDCLVSPTLLPSSHYCFAPHSSLKFLPPGILFPWWTSASYLYLSKSVRPQGSVSSALDIS